jgi:hypothetical protein
MKMETNKKSRSNQQNKAIHKLFNTLSTELNTLGLDARIILTPTYQIWWTPEMIKRDLWCPLQKVMFGTEHTSEMTTDQVSKVYEQLAHIIGEKHGVEISFPSIEDTENYLQSYEN